jgi:hypothetical protein
MHDMWIKSLAVYWPLRPCSVKPSHLPHWIFQAPHSNLENGLQILLQRPVGAQRAGKLHSEDEEDRK